MALVNYATREINAKIVYYGPGLSGKTTNIHYVFNKVKPKNKGKLISLATQGDRTLFFDFLPVELGSVKGFRTRFHLYTVPGQVFYNSTRKLVLKGADGVVFVADSQKMMMDENIQSLDNLRANLSDMGIDFREFPVIMQYNKMDLPEALSVEEMDEYLNPDGRPYFAASAIKGDGVLVALTAVVKNILHNLKQDQNGDFEGFHEDGEPVSHTAEDTVSIKVNEPVQSFMDIKADSEPSMPSIQVVPAAGILEAVEEQVPEKNEAEAASTRIEEEAEPLEAELHYEEDATLAALDDGTAPVPEEALPLQAEETPDITMPLLELAEESTQDDGLGDAYEDFLTNVKSPMIPEYEDEQEVLEEVQETGIEDFGNTDFHVAEILQNEEVAASRFTQSFLDDTEGPAASSPEARRDFLAAQEVHEEIPSPAAIKPAPDVLVMESGPKSEQSFMIPVRITTASGVREVNLKVKVDVGLLGEGVEEVTRIEALQPVSKLPISPRAASDPVPLPAGSERPRQAPAPMPKPTTKEKRPSVFSRFLGIK